MKQFVQNLLAQFGYAIRRTSTLQGYAPGSATRPIAELNLFLEDLRARGFAPRGIIDVGANKGEWTRLALSIFPKTPVLMIEPQEEMETRLSELAKTNTDCYYIKAGAGRQNGELIQTIWEDSEGSSFLPAENPDLLKTGKQRKTRIVTIDSVLAQDHPRFAPDLVKLDIQGFELEALSGAETLFGRTEIFILEASLFPFMPKQPIVRDVISFMADREYELYDIPGRCRRPHDGALGQVDLAFAKSKGTFRKFTDW
ncbi:MAG TPA: FkbM family methyltransferase [Pseudomonadales bacterium]|nr:FkbM family methyltransferase [Pseudomonadales bacterium]